MKKFFVGILIGCLFVIGTGAGKWLGFLFYVLGFVALDWYGELYYEDKKRKEDQDSDENNE